MAVYVDESKYPFGRMIMCHMMADTLDELHAMADKIGIQRNWFQDHPHHPHYDISKSKRKLAVQFGAQQITSRQMVEKFTRIRGLRATFIIFDDPFKFQKEVDWEGAGIWPAQLEPLPQCEKCGSSFLWDPTDGSGKCCNLECGNIYKEGDS